MEAGSVWLQTERYISKNYTSQVNQALSRCFFTVFSENLGRGISAIFWLSIMHACISSSAEFYEFHFKFKEQNS